MKMQKFEDKYANNKKYCKVRDHCHYTGEQRGAEHSVCSLKYSSISKEIIVIFQNHILQFIDSTKFMASSL